MAAPIAIRSSRSHSHKHSLSFAGAAFAPWMCSSHPSNSVGLHSWSKQEIMAISPADMEFSSRNLSSPMGTSIDDVACLVDVQKQHCTGYSCCNRQLPDMHALMDHCDQEHPYNVPKAGLRSTLLPLPLNLHIRPRAFHPSEGIPRLSPTASSTDDDANFEIDMDDPPTPPPSGGHPVYIVSPDADLDGSLSYGHSRLLVSETSLLRESALTQIGANAIKSPPAPFLQPKTSATSDIYTSPHLQARTVHVAHPPTYPQPLSQPLPQSSGSIHYHPSSASALVHLHQTLQARPLISNTSSTEVSSLDIVPVVARHNGRNPSQAFHQTSANNASTSGPIVPPTLLSTTVNAQTESLMTFQRSACADMEDEDQDGEGEEEDYEEYYTPSASRDELLHPSKSDFGTILPPSRSSPKRKASSKKGGGRSQRDTKKPRLSCPKPGCTKLYQNPNGLKYHLDKGTCTFT